MKHFIDKGLDISSSYEVNQYLKEYSSTLKGCDEIMLKVDDKVINDLKLKFIKNNIATIADDNDFIEFMQQINKNHLCIEIVISNKNNDKTYYCSYNQYDVMFFDEERNRIIFNAENVYTIKKIDVFKKIKNKLYYPRLREYLEQVKNIEVMKSFRHEIETINLGCLTITIGDDIKYVKDNELVTFESIQEYLDEEIINIGILTDM